MTSPVHGDSESTRQELSAEPGAAEGDVMLIDKLRTRAWNPGRRFDTAPVPREWIEEQFGPEHLERIRNQAVGSSSNGMILLKWQAEEVAAYFADAPRGPLFPPVTPGEAEAAENMIGRPLPTLLRRIYTEVGDGGFGPDGGLASLTGGRRAPGDLIDWPCSVTWHERDRAEGLCCSMTQTAGCQAGARAPMTACATRPRHCGNGCGPGPMAATSGPKRSASRNCYAELYSTPLSSLVILKRSVSARPSMAVEARGRRPAGRGTKGPQPLRPARGPGCGRMIEALAAQASQCPVPVRSLNAARSHRDPAFARICHDHLAGSLAVAVTDARPLHRHPGRQRGAALARRAGLRRRPRRAAAVSGRHDRPSRREWDDWHRRRHRDPSPPARRWKQGP